MKKKLLLISPYLPTLDEGGRMRVFHAVKNISSYIDVFLVAFIYSKEEEDYAEFIRPFCKELHLVLREHIDRKKNILAKLIRMVFSPPDLITKRSSVKMHRKIDQLVSNNEFDLVQCLHQYTVQFLPAINIPSILVEHNIESEILKRSFNFSYNHSNIHISKNKYRNMYELFKLRRYEVKSWKKFNHIITVSEVDKKMLLMRYPFANITVIPNGVDTKYFFPFNENNKHQNEIKITSNAENQTAKNENEITSNAENQPAKNEDEIVSNPENQTAKNKDEKISNAENQTVKNEDEKVSNAENQTAKNEDEIVSNPENQIAKNKDENQKKKIDVKKVLNKYINSKESIQNNKYGLVFSGTFSHQPNLDAVIYFYEKIFPIIKAQIPDIKFTVAGKNLPEEVVKNLSNDPSVIITGFVKDIRPYIADANLFIVPIRIGSGTRLKILQAMAMKKCIISTSVGCEGIEVKNGENIIISDNENDFATKVIELYYDTSLKEKIAENAYRTAIELYDWKNIFQKQIKLYKELLND